MEELKSDLWNFSYRFCVENLTFRPVKTSAFFKQSTVSVKLGHTWKPKSFNRTKRFVVFIIQNLLEKSSK